MPVAEKACLKCSRVLPLSSFGVVRDRASGVNSRCVECARVDRRAATDRWQRANPTKVKAQYAAYRQRNPEKCRASTRRWRETHPDRQAKSKRSWRLRVNYGLSQEQYEDMASSQGGACAICGKHPKRKGVLRIDHDHQTGVVRGLLCDLCNRAIGMLRDNPEACRSAAKYLERYANRS